MNESVKLQTSTTSLIEKELQINKTATKKNKIQHKSISVCVYL